MDSQQPNDTSQSSHDVTATNVQETNIPRSSDTKLQVPGSREPEFPYVVKKPATGDDEDDNSDMSQADAIMTWLQHWDHGIQDEFLDLEGTNTLWIEQCEEGPDSKMQPLLSVERIYDEIRILYFEEHDKAEYRVKMDKETGRWTPVGATVSGQRYLPDDDMCKLTGSLITSRILYEEPWKTASKSILQVRFGDESSSSASGEDEEKE